MFLFLRINVQCLEKSTNGLDFDLKLTKMFVSLRISWAHIAGCLENLSKSEGWKLCLLPQNSEETIKMCCCKLSYSVLFPLPGRSLRWYTTY